MCRVISFISGKASSGQTSIVYMLSKMLSSDYKRVCVIDAYFGNNNLSLMYNGEGKDLKDFILDNCNLEEVLCKENLYLRYVKSNVINFNYASNIEAIKFIVQQIEKSFDFILIDVDSSKIKELNQILNFSNEAIIISTDDAYSLRNVARLIQKVYLEPNILSCNLILNKMRVISELNNKALGENEISSLLKLEPLYVFPYYYKNNIFNTKNLTHKQKQIFEQFYYSFLQLVRCQTDYKKDYRGLLGSIRRRLYERYE